MATSREKRIEYETEQRRYNFTRMWGKRYAHMKARAEGRSTNSSHAAGKEFMAKEEFFDWCKKLENLDTFLILWFAWAEDGFPLWLTPSVDRINPDLGYTADNIQWMSFSDNCAKNNKHPITHEELTV